MSELAQEAAGRRAVLVVEDEHLVCELLSDILQMEGYEPVCVRHDRQAFEALRRSREFVCMIVDVNLGAGATGYDVARYARRITPGLPVIYVSGQTSEASFAVHGVTGSLFVPKPFTPADLMERVHMLVGDNDD